MRLRSALFTALLLSACSPRVDQSAKSSIDRQIQQLRPGSEQYGAPTKSDPAPLAAGQWIKQHVVDKDGNDSIVTTKVLRVDGTRVWFETETETYSGKTALKALVSLDPAGDPKKMDVHEYWTKSAKGKVEQIPPFLLEAMKPTLRTVLANLSAYRAIDGQEDVSVPAGQFAQAYKGRVKIDALGKTLVSDVWWHPEVPINGGVRAIGVDPKSTTELIAFGTSGAKSVFP